MLSATNTHAIRVTELLLEAGADVDASSADLQMTALLYACKDNNAAAVKLLLQVGASLSACDVTRRSCLHYATLSCPPALIRELHARSRGALLNAADNSGYTPLMIAAEHGRAETASALLDMGANPLLRNKLNHQAIELADWFGQKRIVDELGAWFQRYGLTVRGERLDAEGGRPNVPTSPSMIGTPVPAMLSPLTTPATPSGHSDGYARAGSSTAQDPVAAALAMSGSTVPFSSFRGLG